MNNKSIQNLLQEPSWKEPLKQLTTTLQGYEEFIKRERIRKELIQGIDREIQKTTLSARKVYEIILELGLNEVGADYGHILEIEDDKLFVVANRGEPIKILEVPINGSLTGRALLEKQILNIDDVTQVPKNQYTVFHDDTKSELAIPITDSRGVKNLGVFNIERKTKGLFEDEAVEFCKLLKGQIAIVMEQVKIWEGVKLISELSSELMSGNTDLSSSYDLVLKRVLKILEFKLGQILLLDQNRLLIVASSNPSDLSVSVGPDDSVCGHYIINEKGKETLKIDNIEKSEYEKYYKWLLGKGEDKKMVSEFVVPLLSNNKIIGVINLEDPREAAFSDFDEHILNILGNMIAEAIESGRRQKAIQDMKNAKGASLALAQLGHMSITFLHNLGGKLGNAKVRLIEFKNVVGSLSLPNIGHEPSLDFLEGIINDLRTSVNLLEGFRVKFDPKKIDTKLKHVNIIEVTKDTIQKALHTKPENISLNFHHDESLKDTNIVECLFTDQLYEVLDSLINNAIEAMPNGGKIDTTIALEDPITIQISIKDSGMGMTAETQSRIYDYGYSTKREGRGLGMWFVKLYIEAFAGRIEFKSILNEGTTFYLYFPIAIHDVSTIPI